jgi:hypothetical protein
MVSAQAWGDDVVGSSVIPVEEWQVAALEAMMEAPLPAVEAEMRLSDVLSDDNLFDMVGAVARRDPERALVAVSLDEMANWTDWTSFERKAAGARPAQGWPEPLRERCRDLVSARRGEDVGPLSHSPQAVRGPRAALAKAAACIPGAEVAADRFEVRPGTGPGSHAILDRETGGVFRVEEFYGTVTAAPDGMREHVLASAGFPDEAPGPRP